MNAYDTMLFCLLWTHDADARYHGLKLVAFLVPEATLRINLNKVSQILP